MPILIDHSGVTKLPTARRIKGQTTSGNLVKITLPNLLGAYNVSIGPFFASDGTTMVAGGFTFDQASTNDTAKPSLTTNDTDVDAMTAGEVRTLEIPMRGGSRNPLLFVWVDSANGFCQTRYHGRLDKMAR